MSGNVAVGGGWAAAKTRQREQWKAPFFGCFDDMSSCILSFCVPCVQYGFNAAKIDGSGCFGACCMYACCMMCGGYQCAIGGAKRTSMRNQYMLEESCCCDCCVHWCCCWCALSQEARELEIRGPPPDRSSMPNITIQQNTNNTNSSNNNMPSPGGVMMTNMSGQPIAPMPQGGPYMVGPNGQPMMMYSPGHPMMYGGQPMMYAPGYSPHGFTQAGQPMPAMQTYTGSEGHTPGQTPQFNYDTTTPGTPDHYPQKPTPETPPPA